MNVSQTATKGHLIVGAGLVTAALGCLIASFFLPTQLLPGLIFFFGVWGGVELGRYLEHSLNSPSEENEA